MKKLFILLTILILNILFLSAFSCKVDPVYFQLTISAENGSVIVEDDGQTLSGYSP
jgi:hypothetical protein